MGVFWAGYSSDPHAIYWCVVHIWVLAAMHVCSRVVLCYEVASNHVCSRDKASSAVFCSRQRTNRRVTKSRYLPHDHEGWHQRAVQSRARSSEDVKWFVVGAKDGGARTSNQGVVRAIQCWIGEPIAGVHFKAARVVKLNHGGLDCGLQDMQCR